MAKKLNGEATSSQQPKYMYKRNFHSVMRLVAKSSPETVPDFKQGAYGVL